MLLLSLYRAILIVPLAYFGLQLLLRFCDIIAMSITSTVPIPITITITNTITITSTSTAIQLFQFIYLPAVSKETFHPFLSGCRLL